jgi:MoxR-like ATPase
VAAQREVRGIHVDETLIEYAVKLTEATRLHPDLVLGASPRASLSLVIAAQARSYLDGLAYVLPDTLKHLAILVLRHRLILKPQSILGGKTADHIVRDILEQVELPLAV